MTDATLYLRLSDLRAETDTFEVREARLRAEAARLGWTVTGDVVVENDVINGHANGNGNGRSRPASAFKRRKVITPSGRTELRVYRPGFRSILDAITARRTDALLCEDLDRAMRDPRDLEDLVDACAATGASARSLSGSLTLTNGGTDSEVTMARVMVAMANKSSRDSVRRVSDKRAEQAAGGWYGGGRRPFGYRPDPDAPKYRKTLIIVEFEAGKIRAAAAAVLAGTTLKAVARDWREAGLQSVTGAQWTPSTVRDVLAKPATAGLAVVAVIGADGKPAKDDAGKTITTTVPAQWPAIIEREQWDALRAMLDDPSRRTNTGRANEPRYLLSGIARCHCGGRVKVNGGTRSPAYVCADRAHLRRNAAAADEYVAWHVVDYLSRPENADLLRPPTRPGVDVAALRDEAHRLTEIGKQQARWHALGDIADAEYREGARARKTRLDAIAGQLAATTAPDPLAEFRDQPDAAAVWESLTLPRRRAITRLLVTVNLLPATRRGSGFDHESVSVSPSPALVSGQPAI